MMLRSASTPSLVSSLTAKSPARHQPSPPPAAACGQVSCKCSSTASSHAGFPRSRVNSPEGSDGRATEIRRAQSAGNLEETFNAEEFSLSRQSSRRLSRMPTLEVIPSSYDDGDEEEDEEAEDEDLNIFTVQNLAGLEAATREFNGFCDVGEGKMYLASGIGLNAVGFLEDGGFGGRGGEGGGSSRRGDGFRDSGGGPSLEDHYKSMLMQDPCNPLLLRNYAHFLYQAKRDLAGAEEYYSRALLADPEDGDIMCQYARVIWELHHDKKRAQSYFERAIQASSGECNISASYASFLWDIEDGEDDDEAPVKKDPKINPRLGERFLYHGIMASATA